MKASRATVRVLTAAACLVCAFGSVEAQTAREPSLRAHRFTVSGGFIFSGGYGVGDAMAELRGNAVGATAPPFTLFRAETAIDASAGGEARLGFAVTPGLVVEAGVAYAPPGMTTKLSQDPETAATTLEPERLTQYVIDASVQWHLPMTSLAGRLRPFVAGGGGYLRQLYSEKTLVETGRVYFVGGGVRYWLRGGDGARRSIGLRGDVRLQWRTGGVEFSDRTRLAPVMGLSLFSEL